MSDRTDQGPSAPLVGVQSPRPRSQRIRWVAGVLLAVLPVVVLSSSPWVGNVFLVYVGMLPVVVALLVGVRVAWATAAVNALAVFVGLLFGAHVLLGTVLVVAAGLGVAWSYRRGWQAPATYVATQAALAVVASPSTTLTDASPNTIGSAVLVAGFVLGGGLWVAAVGSVLLFDLTKHRTTPPPTPDLRRFAVVLCGVLAIATPVLMIIRPGSNGWWFLLTVLVVLEPDSATTRSRARDRVVGTVAGALAAAILVVLIDDARVTTAVGVLLVVVTAVVFLLAPYWVFVTTLSSALIFLSFTPMRAIATAEERIVFTVAGAATVVLVGLLSRSVLQRSSTPIDATPHPDDPSDGRPRTGDEGTRAQ